MINIKRQFLDFLYHNRGSCKKIFDFKKDGYIIKLSSAELLKEIDNKTSIGTKIIEELDLAMNEQNLALNLFKESFDEDSGKTNSCYSDNYPK